MKLSQASQDILKHCIKEAVRPYVNSELSLQVTDIHLQAILGSDKLYLFNDDDEPLAEATIKEWSEYVAEDYYNFIEKDLTFILNQLKEEGAFDKLNLMKPYSFVLIDEEKESITELLLVDDDALIINNELLKGLDEELDAFLKQLLED